jgi:hypothetical protein
MARSAHAHPACAGQHVDLAHEVGHEGRGRLAVDLHGRAHLLDHAVVHHHDAVGHAQRLFLVVRHHDGGDAQLLLQARISWRRRTRTMRVQRRQRLVQQQQARARWPARAPAQCAAAGRRRAAPGYLPSLPGRPTSLTSSVTRCAISARGVLAVDQPIGHVVGHAQVGEQRIALEHDAVVALRRRQREMSRPACRMRPAVCTSSPAMMRSSVVLPQPDGPRKQTNSPLRICRSMSLQRREAAKRLADARSEVETDRGSCVPIKKGRRVCQARCGPQGGAAQPQRGFSASRSCRCSAWSTRPARARGWRRPR